MQHKGHFYCSFGDQRLDIPYFYTQDDTVRFKGTGAEIVFESDLVTALVLFIAGVPFFLHYHPGVTLPAVGRHIGMAVWGSANLCWSAATVYEKFHGSNSKPLYNPKAANFSERWSVDSVLGYVGLGRSGTKTVRDINTVMRDMMETSYPTEGYYTYGLPTVKKVDGRIVKSRIYDYETAAPSR
jgi:hypothetical protein